MTHAIQAAFEAIVPAIDNLVAEGKAGRGAAYVDALEATMYAFFQERGGVNQFDDLKVLKAAVYEVAGSRFIVNILQANADNDGSARALEVEDKALSALEALLDGMSKLRASNTGNLVRYARQQVKPKTKTKPAYAGTFGGVNALRRISR